MTPVRVATLTIAALLGFAANSLLCRAAIGANEIDPATFTAIRLLSGALVLFAIARVAKTNSSTATAQSAPSTAPSASTLSRSPSAPSTSASSTSASPITAPSITAPSITAPSITAPSITAPSTTTSRGSWLSASALFAYAAAFSFAYVRLTTATGALLLFAFVQLSMITAGIARGERPRPLEWLGHALAIAGLIALALPGLAAPDPLGAVLMALAGISWGIYSLRGRNTTNPLATTADNFTRTVPMALVLVGAAFALDASAASNDIHATTIGVVLAATSGAIASGIGYSLWYAALPSLPATRAAVVQLSVPAIAAMGGVIALGEVVTTRFVLCALAILGGVAIAIMGRRR